MLIGSDADRHPARLAVTGNSCRAARANPNALQVAIGLARAAIAAERCGGGARNLGLFHS